MEPTKEAEAVPSSGVKPVSGPVVQIDEGRIQAHLDEVVRSTVDETLNALFDAETDRLAEPGSSSAPRAARTRGQAAMTDNCTRKQGM
jgi:hypothetical protein